MQTVMPPALGALHTSAHAADAAGLEQNNAAQPAPRAKQVASQHSGTLGNGGTPTTVMVSLLKFSITSATLSAADCAPCETLSTRDSALKAAWSAAWSKLRCSLSAPSCRSAQQAQLSFMLSGECHCSLQRCHQALSCRTAEQLEGALRHWGACAGAVAGGLQAVSGTSAALVPAGMHRQLEEQAHTAQAPRPGSSLSRPI